MKTKEYEIKIITCHDVYNAGASLQAYALSTYLKNLGHRVENIDYKPYYLKHYELWGVRNPKYDKPVLREMYNILKLPIRIKERFSKRKKAFDWFTKEYLTVTSRTFQSNEELKNARINADVFLAGSDQIWNTVFQNGRDPAFYLDFVRTNAVRASYAASFATDALEEEYQEKIISWIQKLDFVSVREKTGLDILQQLHIDNACQVLDPVFLLSREEWESLLNKEIPGESYVLLYDFDNNEELNEKAKLLANENGWKIYSIFPNKVCDRCFYHEGPLEFLSLIKNAEMVLSNSFHATAFSIIFEKQFLVYDRKDKINTRMRDILETLEITMGKEPIDYKKVNVLLKKQVENSKKYIDRVLAAAEREENAT